MPPLDPHPLDRHPLDEQRLDRHPLDKHPLDRHPLDCWLAEHRRSRQWLADRIGTTEATLSRIIAGKQWPGRKLANDLVRITEGAVTPNDFLPTPEQAASWEAAS